MSEIENNMSREDEAADQLEGAESRNKKLILRVTDPGLKSLSTKPNLLDYARQIWERRHFIWAEAKSKALRSTRDYRLWQLWLILNPFFDVALYGLFFGLMFKTSRGVDNYVGFLVLGIFFMRMITGLLVEGVGLISKSKSMIRAFQFPRAALVFSQTIRAGIDNLAPAFAGLILAFLMQRGEPPSWTIILVPIVYILIHIFCCGIMFIVARTTAQVRETKTLVNMVTPAWFFLSGVMFTVDRFDHLPRVQRLIEINPAYIFLNVVRDVSIYTTLPSLDVWLTLFAWSFGTFTIGFLYFYGAEDRYVQIA